MKVLRGLLTEDDAGTTLCPIRVFGGAGAITFLGNSIHAVIHTGAFDMQAFGIGFSAIIVGIAGGITAKARGGADTIKET